MVVKINKHEKTHANTKNFLELKVLKISSMNAISFYFCCCS